MKKLIKKKVLIVDDSPLFRQLFTNAVNASADFEVQATAGDVFEARERIIEDCPDVMTLDVEMPKMNGIDFLKKLIPEFPIPVVVITSSPTSAFDALNAGAVDFLKKPTLKSADDIKAFSVKLCNSIRTASQAKIAKRHEGAVPAPTMSDSFYKFHNKNSVIAIGASTGSTEAILDVIQAFPLNIPPTVAVLHMPSGFTKMFADRMNRLCAVEVREAADGDRLKPGLVLLAEGGKHLELKKDNAGYFVSVYSGVKVSGHCPSVDVLFESVANTAGKDAVGVILTGMGSDGAAGLMLMKSKGAYTIGQDKDSSVVYGMPMVAFDNGAVTTQLPLRKISADILNKLIK